MTTVLVPAAAGRALRARPRRRRRAARRGAHLRRAARRRGRASRRGRGRSSLRRPVVRAARSRSAPRLVERFHEAHEARYGYADRDRAIELVAVRTAEIRAAPPLTVTGPGAHARGPAGARARRRDRMDPGGLGGRDRRARNAGPPEGVVITIELQVIGASLRAIAEEMGAALIRSAFSANIKERRDCSTALFDERGRMVTQAEHIPVHLGAMPEAVAAVMAHDPAPGEPWILNDPYAGGTHLPDLTIVTRTELGYAVTRAHHADVGGSEPEASARLADARRGGRDHPSDPPRRRRRSSRSSRRCGTPTSGAATCARSSPGTGSPRGASPSCASGEAASESPLRWTSSSPTPSESCAQRFASCRTDASTARTCSRRRRPARRSARR